MTRRTGTIATFGLASIFALTVGVSGVWANEPGYGKEGHGESYGMGGPMSGMMKMTGGMHEGTAHFLRHLVKHQKEIGLSDEQVAKLKEMELNFDRTRIKAEADILVAEREHAALIEDEKSDLAAIEAKIKQSMDHQLTLRMAVIKTKRDAVALLTPEQRTKEKVEHEKMMQQHKDADKGHGSPHGGAMKSNPHKSGDAAHPAPPSSMKVQ